MHPFSRGYTSIQSLPHLLKCPLEPHTHELKLGHKTGHGDCTAIHGMHSEVTMTTVLMCQLSCAL